MCSECKRMQRLEVMVSDVYTAAKNAGVSTRQWLTQLNRVRRQRKAVIAECKKTKINKLPTR